MTWIVGTEVPFGYAAGISDIRVTLANGEERDCLQKIYPVGQHLAMGFAGSVAIGFAMIERFTELLFAADESMTWDPAVVAEWLPEDARQVFDGASEEERELQSHLMLIGVHPSQNNGDSSWPRSYVYTFRFPHFEAVQAKPREVVGIGCGTAVEPCRKALVRLSTDHEAMVSLLQAERTPGGIATMLGMQLTFMLKETQPKGISSHLHFCWVYRGRVVIKVNDHVTVGSWTMFDVGPGVDSPKHSEGRPANQATQITQVSDSFKMPHIANSLEDFEHLLRSDGRSAIGAIS